MKLLVSKIIFVLGILFCISPYGSPPLALLLGIILALTFGNPFQKYNSKATKILLQVSVVGLGFGMNLYEALKAGQQGIIFTIATIVLVLTIGVFLGRVFKIDEKISYLVSSGTAICGGSAIAAVGPVIKADSNQMSVALGTVFILNSAALVLFPIIGHYLNLSQSQFGLWSAIAIHDTSSVVGAAAKYGSEALQVATTVKLVRALWIIPLALFTGFIFKSEEKKINIPYFIFFFIVAMTINTFVPQIHSVSETLVFIAKKGLTITLFLIGAGMSKEALKKVGIKPLMLGIILWVLISIGSLMIIMNTIQ